MFSNAVVGRNAYFDGREFRKQFRTLANVPYSWEFTYGNEYRYANNTI